MAPEAASATPNHRIKLIKVPTYTRNALSAYGKALRKYNIKPTLPGPFDTVDLASPAAAPSGIKGGRPARKLVKKDVDGKIGEISAQDINGDSEYVAQILIGTPGQQFDVVFDTGSADLWVWSSELPKSVKTAGRNADHNIFDQSKSDTFKPSPDRSWSINYADGSSASGSVGKDVLEMGGVIIRNQAIELAESLSTSFQSNPADGLLGLGWGSINTVTPARVRTPIENLVAQSSIQPYAELFTAYLGSYKDANDPDRGQSFYTVGYIDKDVVKSTGSDVHYTNIDKSNGFWQFPSESFTVNGNISKTPGKTAIADTGTTLVLVDDQTLKTIYDAIPGSKMSKEIGGYTFPKATPADKLPIIGFDVGGKTFSLKKEDLAYADVGNGMVYGGIQSSGDLPFSVYGDTFLKAVYAVFDCGRQKFGCVQRMEPDKPKVAEKAAEKLAEKKDEKRDVPVAVPPTPAPTAPAAPAKPAPSPTPAPATPAPAQTPAIKVAPPSPQPPSSPNPAASPAPPSPAPAKAPAAPATPAPAGPTAPPTAPLPTTPANPDAPADSSAPPPPEGGA